jgi:membrane fusion protein, heavy metal efflux system
MNRLFQRLAWGLWFALGACQQSAHDAAEQNEHAEKHEPGGPAAEASDKLIRIEPSMLRDLRVTTQAAEARRAGETVTVLGELRVNEDAYAEVGSSVPARVVRLLAAPGDTVKSGQALLELESPEVGRARASLAIARSHRDLSRQTLERRRGLAADKIVSERELQSSEAELAQAEAELRAAQQALSDLGATQGSGSRFVLTSPIAGTVIDRSALRGSRVSAEQHLFIVSDLARLWLVVHAFERDALRMRPGSSASVLFPALPAQTFAGQVTRIGSRVDPTSRTIDVRIEVDNPAGVLKPGMSASARVPLGDAGQTIVALPVQSLQRLEQGWSVFLPGTEAGVFEMRAVGRGRDLGGEVEVLSGLKAGELVVVDGAFLLKAEADKARGGAAEHEH